MSEVPRGRARSRHRPPSPTLSHSTLPGTAMRFREFSGPFDQAGQLPSVAICAVRRWVSIGCEPAPPHDV
jgi:hypothetical protein